MYRFLLVLVFVCVLAPGAGAQGSSSSTSDPAPQQSSPAARPRQRQADAAGAAITLESDESLFTLAAALNTCGYDAGLAQSAPVRAEVRGEIAAELAASALARQNKDALCGYIAQHRLPNAGRDLAQYISLALYTTPPPELEPSADQTQMPPDALQVVNILPLLRVFAQDVSLHAIWVHHRADYEAITDKAHDPVTKMILDTNIYLKIPPSGYDGRRLQILVEPMLSPEAANARIYATDYTIVVSPTPAGAIHLTEIRHLYLHYEIEPLVYARAQSITRMTPLLKPIADAPLDFNFKSDVTALVAECMIKAIEARTMDVGFPAPTRPRDARDRQAEERYTQELNAFDRAAEVDRRKQVALDERQGWVLTAYFYDQMALFERSPDSLSASMGQMVYGMDIEREREHEKQIVFLPTAPGDFVTRSRPAPTGMELAEKLMIEGRLGEADAMADKALASPAAASDHSDVKSEALYVKARVALLEGDAQASLDEFRQVLATASRPHTAAWAHIYIGRLYDIATPPDRGKAVAEYRAALAVPGVEPDATAAAQNGLRRPFDVPRVMHQEEEPLDPSGKAEKDAYKPDAPR